MLKYEAEKIGLNNDGCVMRKLICIFLVMSVIFLSACEYKHEYNAAHEMAINSTNILLNAFKTGETEELKNLFCDKIKSTHDLDKEILSAIEFMGGNITNDGDYWQGMDISAQSIRDGITTKLSISPRIEGLVTIQNKIYNISFHSFMIYTDNTQLVGMTRITVYDADDHLNYFVIGEIM